MDKAIEEFKKLLEMEKDNISFDYYIKRKKIEKIIFDNLKKLIYS